MKLILSKSKSCRASLIALLGFLVLLVSSCDKQPDYKYVKSDATGKIGMNAWQFIQANSSFSIMKDAIERAQLQEKYTGGEAKTFILPTDEAFKNYLKSNSYTSIANIPIPILKNLLQYHIIDKKIVTSDTALIKGGNPLAFKTENGQQMYLSHNNNYQLVINAGTSKSWIVEVSNIEPTNGAIQVSPSVVYYSAVIPASKADNNKLTADTITVIQDTYILGGSSQNTNFGTEKLLKVKNVDGKGPYDRRAFLMYDLKQITTKGNLREAIMEVGISFTHGKGVDLYLLNVQDNSWSENSLTWANAPAEDPVPIAKITSSKVSSFKWDVTNYINEKLKNPGKISIKIDGEPRSDETDEFFSRRSEKKPHPRLILTFSSGISNLEMGMNSGLTVPRGGVKVFDESMLNMKGAAYADIIYKLVTLPAKGWLIRGANILKAGSEFSQLDINAQNIVYVHNGDSGSTDSFSLSVRDPDGGKISPFIFNIKVQ